MTYDDWKTTNPDDEWLGPEPDMPEDQDTVCRNLLCVGGPSAGTTMKLDMRWKDIRIPDPSPASWNAQKIISPPVCASIAHTCYTRRVLRSSDGKAVDEVMFLAPEGMKDMEAFRELLRAYREAH